MTSSPWIAALAGAAIFAASLPASAQVVRFDPGVKDAASPLFTDVQFRGGHGMRHLPHGGGFGHRGFGGGPRFGGGRRYGGGGYGYRGGRGAAIGAGVAGLAAGALIGGALAAQAAPAYGYGYGYGDPAYAGDPGYAYAPVAPAGDDTAYCSQRYKSYDPSSGTYLGYDGLRHPCP
ncbi:BA14K family protein [Lichenifustis flavocetrariae]|uniref:Lectin-like protein BA14k n=1 Tax=Lichenifustis flavocetrariae TaxID=2949735 RepID=A0AA42CIF6_9HYPH|nr:BA14K family protein [Lichenifustis flavocetrariae]MCW6508314.1 BA14K family protein [Lichenifustis flavocetrariae]